MIWISRSRKNWAGSAVKLLNDVFPEDHLDNVQSWAKCSILLPHALAAAGHAEKLDVEPEATGRLLNESGLYLRTRGEFVDARDTLKEGSKDRRAGLRAGLSHVATRVNNLGLVLQDLGDLQEARKCFERALKIGEKVYGPDHPDVATMVNNLGVVLQYLGDLQEARKCYERALKIDEKVYGPDHPTCSHKSQQPRIGTSSSGRLTGSQEMFRESSKDRREGLRA